MTVDGRLLFHDADDADDGERLRMLLSWHPKKPSSPSTPPWTAAASAAVATDGDRAFHLPLDAAPGPDALMTLAEFDGWGDDLPADGRLALGTLTAYWTTTDTTPTWLQLFEDGLPAVTGTQDNVFVLFWAGSETLTDQHIPLYGGSIEPGFNLVEVITVETEDGSIWYAYLRHPMTQLLDVPFTEFGGPSFQRCRWDGTSPVRELWPGDEGYPDPLPERGEAACSKCETAFVQEHCAVAFGVLCNHCQLFTYFREPTDKTAWPCSIEGEYCEPAGERRCSAHTIYVCQDEKWTLDEACPATGECCDAECRPFDE